MSAKNNERSWQEQIKPTPIELWEIEGYCENEKCRGCTTPWNIHNRRVTGRQLIGTPNRIRVANHSITYFKNKYTQLMKTEDVVCNAFGFLPYIEGIAEGELFDSNDIDCAYHAARVYRESAGLLEAICSWFSMSNLDEHLATLRANWWVNSKGKHNVIEFWQQEAEVV